MRQGLQQGVRQEMTLLPRMLQSIEVLQLALGELEPFLQQAVLENEALALEPGAEGAGEAGAEKASAHTDPGDSGDSGDDARGEAGGGLGRARGEASDRHAAWMESLPGAEGGLVEHLLDQVALGDCADELEPWVRFCVRALDESGVLSLSDAELLRLAADEGIEGADADGAALLGRAIAFVQTLEPRGVGGRDIVEVLLLQLDPDEDGYGLLCRLLEEFLEDVARNKLPAVARGLGIDLARLEELLGRLRELDPRPAAGLSSEPAPTIVPDVVVREAEDGTGEFEVHVVSSGLPAIRLDGDVQELASDPRQPAGVRSYLRDKLDRARWILRAVEQREETLLRVASWIFERQQAFLRRGPSELVPLTMTTCSEDLGIHLSTVSRAVAGKYAETPWGVRSLRELFPAAAAGSDDVARGSVQESLQRLIDAEDTHAPLSDDELVRRLATLGFKVARRTVAKYRRELGIPSSYRRRRYDAAG